MQRRCTRLGSTAAALAVTALLAGGCRDGNGSASADKPQTIAQPVIEGVDVAPDSDRVDLDLPTFSDPTNVTNPLFPVSKQKSVLLLGHVDGKPFRTEVTLLPETRIIEWQGRRVETLVSQYVAYLDGRIEEVTYDYYAQDDAGAVWYFGEDVVDFRGGVIFTSQGTWTAGKDGPAAMIMSAHPKVGDVWRTENIPGLAFEEITVKAVDQTLDGPLGPVEGGLVVEELHADNTTEDKTFAPGYGEFLTTAGGNVEALAVAVPTDALSGPAPAGLVTLERGARNVFDAAGIGDWQAAQATVRRMAAGWKTAGVELPDRLGPQLNEALGALAAGVGGRNAHQTREAAIDVARWSLDLQLRHRPVAAIDLARFDLWAAQLLVDAAAGDAPAVNGDVFTLDYIRDRIQHTLKDADRTRVNTELDELATAVADEDLAATTDAARRLRMTVAELS